jgi:hypothetical protein
MTERTASQQASDEMARAVFADPELRERFQQMAVETAKRVPVPDDFAWLSPEADQEITTSGPPVSP